jgi:Flp pilus assembly protein TadG
MISFIAPYARNKSGNVALMGAMLMFIILLAVGGGVDFMQAQKVRAKLQDAGDAAVLAAVLLPRSASDAARLALANQVFEKYIQNLTIADKATNLVTQKTGKNTEAAFQATAKVKTSLLGLIGMDELTVRTISKSALTMKEAEIVWVLDTTFSMSKDARMTNLKSAFSNVIPEFEDDNGDNFSETKMAVIPFHTQVRLTPGTGYGYVDYGIGDKEQGCEGYEWKICRILLSVYEQICTDGSDSDLTTCFSRVKAYTKVWSSGSDNFVRVDMKSHLNKGSPNRIYHSTETWRFYPKWNDGGSGCYTNEYGQHCWNNEPGWGEGSERIEHENNKINAGNLTFYDEVPSGMDSVNEAATFIDKDRYNNGYGARPGRIDRWNDDGANRSVKLDAVPDGKHHWTGCIIDRDQPYDTMITAANASKKETLYHARPCESDDLKIMQPLTEDLTLVKNKVASLVPNGETNITIGVQWGMEAFTPSEPLTGGAPLSNKEVRRYMILITDGENTRSRFSNNTTDIDKRTELACKAAKDEGIVVYVVKVIEGNSDLLKGCASDPDKFYDLNSASQLNDAVSDIVASMKKIRLTQ